MAFFTALLHLHVALCILQSTPSTTSPSADARPAEICLYSLGLDPQRPHPAVPSSLLECSRCAPGQNAVQEPCCHPQVLIASSVAINQPSNSCTGSEEVW